VWYGFPVLVARILVAVAAVAELLLLLHHRFVLSLVPHYYSAPFFQKNMLAHFGWRQLFRS
jgi:hypothetical protein